MTERRLLIIDDDAAMIKDFMTLAVPGELSDFEVEAIESLDDAVSLIRGGIHFNVVLLDVHFGTHSGVYRDGLAALPELRSYLPTSEIIIYSGDDDSAQIARARELGASGVFAKHHYSLLDIAIKVRRALTRLANRQASKDEGLELAKAVGAIFASRTMAEVFTQAATVKRVGTANALITGPTGSGKDLVAQAIGSGKSKYIAVNCAAMPDTLIESELFGHERGAFTGAQARKIGLFEMANGGTLFLDEVGTLSRKAQEALLRVLQTGEFKRLGGHETLHVKVRVIAATNEDLAAKIAEGTFREDLFERLAAYKIQIPSLGERREDIEPLVVNIVQKSIKPYLQIDPTCMHWLREQNWPRNVRQLENVVTQMVHACSGTDLEMGDVPASLFQELSRAAPRRAVDQVRSATVGRKESFVFKMPFGLSLEDVLDRCAVAYISDTASRQNSGLTIRGLADMLLIPYTNLHRRLAKYGLVFDRIVSSESE